MRIRRGSPRRRRTTELLLNVRIALWFFRRLWRPATTVAIESVRARRR